MAAPPDSIRGETVVRGDMKNKKTENANTFYLDTPGCYKTVIRCTPRHSPRRHGMGLCTCDSSTGHRYRT